VDAVLGVDKEEGAPSPELQRVYDEALDAMCDDLNTSVAIAKAIEGARISARATTESEARAGRWFMGKINALLGVVCGDDEACDEQRTSEEPAVEGRSLSEWIEEREAAKQSRDFATADAIRNRLAAAGIELRDSPEGTTWVRRPVGV
jgi:cysteinyl-tRNA synthetase